MIHEIIPAIMPEHFSDIEDMTSLVVHTANTVQLDIMDGKYVSEKTWPFNYKNDRDLESLLSQDMSLPFWEEINYELDLMIERPEEELEKWLGIGAARVIFHYASINDWTKIESIDETTRNFITIGCAVTVHDNLENIYPLIEHGYIDFIQVMGISHIGYQGEPFEESSLTMIETLRSKYPELLITVDGGVSLDTITELHQAGAHQFISGSGVFAGGVATENILELHSYLNQDN